MINKNYYAIVMAGGVGSRFWPVSTKAFPKQFHDMLGSGLTLIQKTYSRLVGIIPEENIYVLTNKAYKDLVFEQLPNFKTGQVLLEPAMRNTAPCILYAALKIQKINKDALIVVAPSDHWIEDETGFTKNVETAFDFCSKNNALVTLGIQPTFPNTGYGYIEYIKQAEAKDGSPDAQKNTIKPVKQFREKPNYTMAKQFVEQGNFLWNAGIFIWSAQTIIEAFKKLQPAMYQLFLKGINVYNTEFEDDFINENYVHAENISVDFAIMEQSKNVMVIPATFDWNDLGTWGSLYAKLDKDNNSNAVVSANALLEDASGNLIKTDKNKLVVANGLKDYIIVDKEDVLLIYPQSKEQDIKQVLQNVKSKFGEHYG